MLSTEIWITIGGLVMRRFNFNTSEMVKLGIFKSEHSGDYNISGVSSNKNIYNNSIAFFKEWGMEQNNRISCEECLLIVPLNADINNIQIKNYNYIIYSENPRRDYAIILDFILSNSRSRRQYKQLENFIVIGENVSIGEDTDLEPFIFIDHDVVIASGCKVKSGVRIGSNVEVGENTIIRENSVIGGQGFGVERDNEGKTYKIPHLGGVIIGKNVEIGALNTIVSGTIDATIIEDYVRTDDHVHIAHNCNIKKSTFITACVEISGSVTVGKNSIIGPNSSIMNKISLGENTIVGLGTVVTKSFGDNVVLAGSPADTIENVKKNRAVLKKVVQEY